MSLTTLWCTYAKGSSSSKCPFCNVKDGRAHRVWHCSGTKQFRERYPEVMEWLSNQDTVVAQWGLLSD